MRIQDRVMDLSGEEGARMVALGLLTEACSAAGDLVAGAGDEPLHDFRVAVRRLRSLLRTFRPWLAGSVRRKDERRLGKIARSTNVARDAEVQLAWLEEQRPALAAARQRAGHDIVVSRFEARAHHAPDAERAAARFLRAAERLQRRLARDERQVDAAGEPPAGFGAVLSSLVADQLDALSGRMAGIRGADDEEAVHRARIEGKRLRYLLEPLRGYSAADAAGVIATLKRLQDLLGDLHDAHVMAAELGETLAEAASERARQLHAAVLSHAASVAAVRDRLRASPRPGVLALVRLVRERRDSRFAELEREWRRSGLARLVEETRALSAALEARAANRTATP